MERRIVLLQGDMPASLADAWAAVRDAVAASLPPASTINDGGRNGTLDTVAIRAMAEHLGADHEWVRTQLQRASFMAYSVRHKLAFVSRHAPTWQQTALAAAHGYELVHVGGTDGFALDPVEFARCGSMAIVRGPEAHIMITEWLGRLEQC
jgi:hypothetical protein